ncbi:unnamed protein product, partial [Tetraodon nigroviridis]
WPSPTHRCAAVHAGSAGLESPHRGGEEDHHGSDGSPEGGRGERTSHAKVRLVFLPFLV